MSDKTEYMTVNALSLPLLDQEGKQVGDRERLVTSGQVIQLDPADEVTKRALASGAVRELTDQEKEANQPPERREGDEVNGPGVSALIGSPDLDVARPESREDSRVAKLDRPAEDATYQDWAKYAKQEGVDGTGGKAAIQERFAERDRQQAASQDAQ